MCGTDTYVIVENLRQLATNLAVHNKKQAMYLGRRFLEDNALGNLFNSGGAGYVLNARALTALIDALPESYCEPHLRGFWEDVMVSKCLKGKEVPVCAIPYFFVSEMLRYMYCMYCMYFLLPNLRG